jgi:hypothetical protein
MVFNLSFGLSLFLCFSSMTFAQSIGTSPSLRDTGFEKTSAITVIEKKSVNPACLPMQQRIQSLNLSEGIPYSPVKEFQKNPRLTPELKVDEISEDLLPFGPPIAKPDNQGTPGELNLKYDVSLLPVNPQSNSIPSPALEKTQTPQEAAQTAKDEISVSPFLKWVETQKQMVGDKSNLPAEKKEVPEDERVAIEKQRLLEDLYLKIRFPYLGSTPEPVNSETTTTTGRGSVTYSTPDNSPPPPPKKH